MSFSSTVKFSSVKTGNRHIRLNTMNNSKKKIMTHYLSVAHFYTRGTKQQTTNHVLLVHLDCKMANIHCNLKEYFKYISYLLCSKYKRFSNKDMLTFFSKRLQQSGVHCGKILFLKTGLHTDRSWIVQCTLCCHGFLGHPVLAPFKIF